MSDEPVQDVCAAKRIRCGVGRRVECLPAFASDRVHRKGIRCGHMEVLRRRSLKVCGDTSGRRLGPREPGRRLELPLRALHGWLSEPLHPRRPQQPPRLPPRGRLGLNREWLHIGLVLGLCIAVLPCVPRARTQVGELPSNRSSASTKAAGHGSGGRKVCENRRAFSHCPVLGARLVRALQNCCALSRWQGDYFAIRCRDGGRRSRGACGLPREEVM